MRGCSCCCLPLTTRHLCRVARATSSTTRSQAWKACGCDNPAAAASAAIESVAKLGNVSIDVDLAALLKLPAVNASLPQVVAQWAGAAKLGLALPKLVLAAPKVAALKALVPGFVAPALVVSAIAKPLLALPAGLKLPVPLLTLPAGTLPSVQLLLPNLTSLPTLVLPAGAGAGLGVPALQGLKLPNLTRPDVLNIAAGLAPVLPDLSLLTSLGGLSAALQPASLEALVAQGVSAAGNIANITRLAGLVTAVQDGMARLNLTLPAQDRLAEVLEGLKDALPAEVLALLPGGGGAAPAAKKMATAPGTAAGIAAGEGDAIAVAGDVADDDDDTDGGEEVPAGASAATAFLDPQEFAKMSEAAKAALQALLSG